MSIGRAGLLVGCLSVVSMIFGFVRDAYITYRFGATWRTDVFYVCTSLPDMFASWIGYSLTNVAVSEFKSIRSSKGVSFASAFAAGLVLTAGVFMGLITIVMWSLTPQIIAIIAPGFSVEQKALAYHMLRLMLLSIPLSGLSALYSGFLNATENYTTPALGGTINNGTLVASGILASANLGINSLSWGVVFGQTIRLMILVFAATRRRVVRYWKVVFPLGTYRKMWMAAFTIFLSVSVTQVNSVVDRMLGSTLVPGSLTILNLAQKVSVITVGVLGSTMATIIYPKLIDADLATDVKRGADIIVNSIRVLFFVAAMSATFVMFEAKSVIYVVFHHGLFSVSDVQSVSVPFKVYQVGAAFLILVPMLVNSCYSRGATRLPTAISFGTVSINVVLSLTLIRSFSLDGLVIANTVANIFNGVSLVFVVIRLWEIRIGRLVMLLLRDLRYVLAAGGLVGIEERVVSVIFGVGLLGWLHLLLSCGVVTLVVLVRFRSSLARLMPLRRWNGGVTS